MAATDSEVTVLAGRSGLEVHPMTGYTGAELGGVDLRSPLDPETLAAVRAALLRWRVVFFRDQHIGQAEHLAFASQFGEPTPAHPTLPAMFPDYPQILLLDNELIFGGADTSVEVESPWHTDVTFLPNPPMASILRGVVVPEHGGDTQWTNLVVAYERLSDPIKVLIDGLHAVHVNSLHIARGEVPLEIQEQFASRPIRAVHPMVRVHPETGERALFVNPGFTDHVVELSRRESRHLLDMLYEHLTNPDFTVRFRWAPGSLAFWDNRVTTHRVPTDIPPGVHRSMQRITLAGDLAVGPDGSRSYPLEVPT